MNAGRLLPALIFLTPFAACGPGPVRNREISVAAAANLAEVFSAIAPVFEAESGVRVHYSFGATAQLTRQIENAAPYDVIAAADTEHVDQLDRAGLLVPQSQRVYARGQLVLWIPDTSRAQIHSLPDLLSERVRFISVAEPELAPYGQAAVEALKAAQLWEGVRDKVVYAGSVNMSKQYAETGNADASFTAYSLVVRTAGQKILIDEKLHRPLDQAVAIVRSSRLPGDAARFIAFLLGTKGQSTFAQFGYLASDSRLRTPK